MDLSIPLQDALLSSPMPRISQQAGAPFLGPITLNSLLHKTSSPSPQQTCNIVPKDSHLLSMKKAVGYIGCWEEVLECSIIFQLSLDIFTAVSSSIHLLRPIVRALPFLASPEAEADNWEEHMDAQQEIRGLYLLEETETLYVLIYLTPKAPLSAVWGDPCSPAMREIDISSAAAACPVHKDWSLSWSLLVQLGSFPQICAGLSMTYLYRAMHSLRMFSKEGWEGWWQQELSDGDCFDK